MERDSLLRRADQAIRESEVTRKQARENLVLARAMTARITRRVRLETADMAACDRESLAVNRSSRFWDETRRGNTRATGELSSRSATDDLPP